MRKKPEMEHQFVEIQPGWAVCACPSCSAESFRALARAADAGATSAMISRAARLQAGLLEQVGLAMHLRKVDIGTVAARSRQPIRD